MKYVDDFRNPEQARKLVEQIRRRATQRWVLMDVCGGQTHSLMRYGIEAALADCVELIHGPGCPVCVTPSDAIDAAQYLALQPGVILASFGDMLRVPGSQQTLMNIRARGGEVRFVYSPIDAIELAKQNPNSHVVFFAVGFETTAPATALAILHAKKLGLENFSVLASHVRVLPAMEALLQDSECRIQAFLAAGHVCTVTGYQQYEQLIQRFQIPIVIAGFEPLDLLQAIWEAVGMLESELPSIVNCYARSVRPAGNQQAQATVDEVYEIADQAWRGFGVIPHGGLKIRQQYRHFDASKRFKFEQVMPLASSMGHDICMSAEVMSGRIKPPQCPYFGVQCTTEHPLGAPMVSSEGACAAYMLYHLRGTSIS
ncbi:MAG: hydrogenase formation protein HypD [Planctomycetales bacterium]|nr:hydrogenase formation protein HypD [Planctomycetales bacterium]